MRERFPGITVVHADASARKYAAGAARRFSLAVGLTLPRRAFLPPPQVDSAVLVIRRRGAPAGVAGARVLGQGCIAEGRTPR